MNNAAIGIGLAMVGGAVWLGQSAGLGGLGVYNIRDGLRMVKSGRYRWATREEAVDSRGRYKPGCHYVHAGRYVCRNRR